MNTRLSGEEPGLEIYLPITASDTLDAVDGAGEHTLQNMAASAFQPGALIPDPGARLLCRDGSGKEPLAEIPFQVRIAYSVGCPGICAAEKCDW